MIVFFNMLNEFLCNVMSEKLSLRFAFIFVALQIYYFFFHVPHEVNRVIHLVYKCISYLYFPDETGWGVTQGVLDQCQPAGQGLGLRTQSSAKLISTKGAWLYVFDPHPHHENENRVNNKRQIFFT